MLFQRRQRVKYSISSQIPSFHSFVCMYVATCRSRQPCGKCHASCSIHLPVTVKLPVFPRPTRNSNVHCTRRKRKAVTGRRPWTPYLSSRCTTISANFSFFVRTVRCPETQSILTQIWAKSTGLRCACGCILWRLEMFWMFLTVHIIWGCSLDGINGNSETVFSMQILPCCTCCLL